MAVDILENETNCGIFSNNSAVPPVVGSAFNVCQRLCHGYLPDYLPGSIYMNFPFQTFSTHKVPFVFENCHLNNYHLKDLSLACNVCTNLKLCTQLTAIIVTETQELSGTNTKYVAIYYFSTT